MNPLLVARIWPAQVDPDRSSVGSGLANLLTPHPREVFVADSSAQLVVTLDLGQERVVDTVFLGFTNAPAGSSVIVSAGRDQTMAIGTAQVRHTFRVDGPGQHAMLWLPQPLQGRYFRLQLTGGGNQAARAQAAVAAVGLSITSAGYELGGGRPLSDSGRVDRLPDGGFSVRDGAAAGGYAWSFPVLTDDERDRLYALALDVGTTGTVLVAEESDGELGANERLHWGKLTKLEPYAVVQRGETKWALQVQDWA